MNVVVLQCFFYHALAYAVQQILLIIKPCAAHGHFEPGVDTVACCGDNK